MSTDNYKAAYERQKMAREQAEHANVVSELLKTKQDLADCLRRESEAKVLDVVVAKEASLVPLSVAQWPF